MSCFFYYSGFSIIRNKRDHYLVGLPISRIMKKFIEKPTSENLWSNLYVFLVLLRNC